MFTYKCKLCSKDITVSYSRPRIFCSLSCNTKYRHEHRPFSKFVKGHKVRVGMKHPLSFVEGRKNEGNPLWKGDKASVKGIHCWIRDNFAKTGVCESCKEYKRTDWSNKDHKYKRERNEWQELCRSCHQKYDYSHGLRQHHKG